MNPPCLIKDTVNPLYFFFALIFPVFVIRKFQLDDMFSVIKLASETLTEQYSPILFSYFYEVFPEGFLVVENHGEILGFIIGVKTTPMNGRILMIGVAENHRRQGLGSALIKQLLKEFIAHNISQVELEVETSNTAAISFYQKHHFKIVETVKQFYQNGNDAYVMRWQLHG